MHNEGHAQPVLPVRNLGFRGWGPGAQEVTICTSPHQASPDFAALMAVQDSSISAILALSPELVDIVAGFRALSHTRANQADVAIDHLRADSALRLLIDEAVSSCGSLADKGEEVNAAIQAAITRCVRLKLAPRLSS